MIHTEEAEGHLRTALVAVGFRFDAPDLRLAWEAFRAFAAVPAAAADDAFLFQYGVHTFSGRERFHWDLTRQFSHEDDDGAYAGMEQVHLTIYYAPDDALRALRGSLWSYDFADRERWCAGVEGCPGFAAGEGLEATGCEVWQSDV